MDKVRDQVRREYASARKLVIGLLLAGLVVMAINFANAVLGLVAIFKAQEHAALWIAIQSLIVSLAYVFCLIQAFSKMQKLGEVARSLNDKNAWND